MRSFEEGTKACPAAKAARRASRRNADARECETWLTLRRARKTYHTARQYFRAAAALAKAGIRFAVEKRPRTVGAVLRR